MTEKKTIGGVRRHAVRVLSSRVDPNGCTVWRVERVNGRITSTRASKASKAALKEASDLYSVALEHLAKR